MRLPASIDRASAHSSVAGGALLRYPPFRATTRLSGKAPEWPLLAILVSCCLATLAAPGAAQPVAAPDTVAGAAVSQARVAAGHITDLIAGQLAPEVDVARLFRLPLADGDLVRTRAVLAMVDDGRLFDRARADSSVLTGLTGDQAALAIAQARFLRLPASRRNTLISQHEQAVRRAAAERERANQAAQELAGLRSTLSSLQAFLAGEKADSTALFLDALEVGGAMTSSARRAVLLDSAGADATAEEPSATDSADGAGALRRQVDLLRARILALSPEERSRLVAAQLAAPAMSATADEARRQVEESARAAAAARSEFERLIATERTRLLRVREAQARAEEGLAELGQLPEDVRELALGWRRQVRELLDRPQSGARRAADADRLYVQLVDALERVRGDLGRALGTSTTLDVQQLTPAPLDDAIPTGVPEEVDLEALHEELVDNLARLRNLDGTVRRERRDALFTAMTDMNAVRLSLIPALSGAMRGRVTGFGEEGFAQVRREVNQMTLTLRHTFVSGPARASLALQPLLHPTPRLVLSLLILVMLALGFRYWRRHGDDVLLMIERANATRQPPTLLSTGLALAIGYLRRVRRPLEWLILVTLFSWLIPEELNSAALRFLWILVRWVLFTAFMVQLLDVLAQGRRLDDPRAALRQRSLLLVAGVILVVGLILSLTSQSVGRGAIYNWVFRACWLLLIPVALILASWWRARIVALAEAAGPASPFLAWSARNHEGVFGNVVLVFAGVVLLFTGARAIVTRRVNEIALIREFSDQRQRVRAAARVAADEESGRFHPLPAAMVDGLAPHRVPSIDDPSIRTRPERPVPTLSPGAILALVGERGLGKSTMLGDLTFEFPPERVLRIPDVSGGFRSICSQLAALLDVECDLEQIRVALVETPGRVITVDDLQRLVVPAIGGLEDFDQLVELARTTSPATTWILAIGSPAWLYIRRARDDRAIFDSVVLLPRWNAADIRALVERRTEQSGLTPTFDPLDSSQVVTLDADLSPEERTRRAYFTELADYSAGNPAVAMEFWRRSLFLERDTRNVVVRTYRTPDTEVLAALPETTSFVLRTILQMEVASLDNIQRCTDLGSVTVSDATRILARMGVITEYEYGYRVTLFWYREVRRLLERRNLLGKVAA